MIKVAMLSYWHVHAWDYTNQVKDHPDTEVVAVWDEIPERGKEAAERLGVPFYANLDEVLALDNVDAVVVDSPTNTHRDIMVKAAQAGKHIFTEKVIAPTVKEVNEILEAVQEAGVKLTVSLPRLNDAYTLAIQDVLSKGQLGKLTQARVRLSHNGATADWLPKHFYNKEQCGGGAMIDLGCHPMYLSRLFLGMPESVHATYSYITGKEVEDNAISILHGIDGSIGIVEAGFVNSHSPFFIEVHGTEGSLIYNSADQRMMFRSNVVGHDQWTEIELGANRSSAMEQWVQHIQNDTIATENIQLAKDLTILMEASNISAQEKRSVRIDELI